MTPETPLTPHEARFIAAALAHDTQEAAAAALRCHVRTYQRTLGRPHVAAALAREAVQQLRKMTVALARHSDAAVRSLGQMAAGAMPANSARVRACIAIAELGARAVEIEGHEVRLAAIEDELRKRGAPPEGRRWQ